MAELNPSRFTITVDSPKEGWAARAVARRSFPASPHGFIELDFVQLQPKIRHRTKLAKYSATSLCHRDNGKKSSLVASTCPRHRSLLHQYTIEFGRFPHTLVDLLAKNAHEIRRWRSPKPCRALEICCWWYNLVAKMHYGGHSFPLNITLPLFYTA
jgi:hypothetical protein